MKTLPHPSPPPGHARTRRLAAALALALLGAATPARAQLRLPTVGVPGLGRLPSTTTTTTTTLADTVQQALPLQELRADTERELLRRHPDRLEADPAGHPVRRAELVWLSPSADAVQRALGLGFVVLRESALPELGLRELVMRAPARVGLAEAATRLRALEPGADVDFNHLYLPSGRAAGEPGRPSTSTSSAPGPATTATATATTTAAATATAPASPPAGAAGPRLGMIDGGLDRGHPSLAATRLQSSGCDGRALPSAHGTAVASLLVGRDGAFAGMRPDARLYAADVYCDQPDGGAAEDVARALAWMVREQVPVINVSLVGPPNALLARAVAAVVRQGHLVVAAVGNDGPAAPPLYPASYPGVVGATGVTPARRALPEAAQGPQVTLAAPGSDVAVAQPGGGYVVARGTSFAAPFVAGLLVDALPRPDAKAAAAALAQLEQGAVDLGAPGRDDVYGHGLVGEAARTPPARVSAQRR